MVKVTQDILWGSWFGAVILLDRIGRIFNIPLYIMDITVLITSIIFLYAIHRVAMNDKKNSMNKGKINEG